MLTGATTLVVEDEYLIALEVQRILEAAGAAAIISAPAAIGDAVPQGGQTFDLAIVSIRPDRNDELELCEALRQRGIAIVALTAASEHAGGVPGLDAVPVVIKPFADSELLAAATAALLATPRSPHHVS